MSERIVGIDCAVQPQQVGVYLLPSLTVPPLPIAEGPQVAAVIQRLLDLF